MAAITLSVDGSTLTTASLIYITSLFLLTLLIYILYNVIYTYFLRREPYFYTTIDSTTRLHTVNRVVPFREWCRRLLKKPRSASDVHRDEEFVRVQSTLNARGWHGRVLSDGSPDLTYMRRNADVDSDDDDHHDFASPQRVRTWQERQDTRFWREQAQHHPRDLFAQAESGYGTFADLPSPPPMPVPDVGMDVSKIPRYIPRRESMKKKWKERRESGYESGSESESYQYHYTGESGLDFNYTLRTESWSPSPLESRPKNLWPRVEGTRVGSIEESTVEL